MSLTPTGPVGTPLDLGADPATALTVLGGAQLAELRCLTAVATVFTDTQKLVPQYDAQNAAAATPVLVPADSTRVTLTLRNAGPGTVWWGRTDQVAPQPAPGEAAQTGGNFLLAGEEKSFDYREAGATYYAWTDPAALTPSVVCVQTGSTAP